MINRILIGIDPGSHTGVAVIESGSESFTYLWTLSFWFAIKAIETYAHMKEPMTVVMEDPNGNRPVFNRGIDGRRASKIAQNVGMNKRDAQLIEAYCLLNDIPILKVRPSAKSMTKLSAEQFEKVTGYKGRTSEHSRDAGMLIWSMK